MVEKKLPRSCEWKRQQVDPDHDELSVRRQCELLDLSRSSLSYESVDESVANPCIDGSFGSIASEISFFGNTEIGCIVIRPEEE